MKKFISLSLVLGVMATSLFASASEKKEGLTKTPNEWAKAYTEEILSITPSKLNAFTTMTGALNQDNNITVFIKVNVEELFNSNKLDYKAFVSKTKAEQAEFYSNMLSSGQTAQVNYLCSNPDTRVALDNSVVIGYEYSVEKDGTFMGRTEIKKEDCK